MKTALEKHIELNHYNPSVLEHIFECVRLGKQDFADKINKEVLYMEAFYDKKKWEKLKKNEGLIK